MSDEDMERKLCERVPAIAEFRRKLTRLLDSKTKYTKGLYVVGPAGISKSHHVKEELEKREVNFAFYNSHTTALGLYEVFFQMKSQDSVVVLDDVSMILTDPKSLGILKAALFSPDDSPREITWNSTSKVLKERKLPSRFAFNGRLIILTNEVHDRDDESFKAFLDRMHVCRMELTMNDRKQLVRTIVMNEAKTGLDLDTKEKLMIALEGSLDFSNANGYNLRTAFRAIESIQNGEAIEQAIMDLLPVNEDRMRFSIIESAEKLSVDEKAELWMNKTGHSKRTYFRYKKKYMKETYSSRIAIQREKEELLESIRQKTGGKEDGQKP